MCSRAPSRLTKIEASRTLREDATAMRDSRGGQSKHHHANVWLVLLAEVGRPNAEDPWVASSLCARTAPGSGSKLISMQADS